MCHKSDNKRPENSGIITDLCVFRVVAVSFRRWPVTFAYHNGISSANVVFYTIRDQFVTHEFSVHGLFRRAF